MGIYVRLKSWYTTADVLVIWFWETRLSVLVLVYFLMISWHQGKLWILHQCIYMQMLHRTHTRFKTASTVWFFSSSEDRGRQTEKKTPHHVVWYINVAWIRCKIINFYHKNNCLLENGQTLYFVLPIKSNIFSLFGVCVISIDFW